MINRVLLEDYINRDVEWSGVERELKIPLNIKNKIISIVGPRRAGKSWLLIYYKKQMKRPFYVNFEDIAFSNIKAEEFFEVIKIFSENKYKPKQLLLDEIQETDRWNILVRTLLDKGYQLFLTGSSSKLLSKEIATNLRGRSLTYLLLPFSFGEFLRANNVTNLNVKIIENRGKILRLIKEYLNYGGFPEVVFDKENRERLLKQYFDEIFYKDFVERHKVKSMSFGRFMLEYIFQNYSKELSFKKIKNLFSSKISNTTLYDYVDKLEDTLSVFFLTKYSPSSIQRNTSTKKAYVCDTGIPEILTTSLDIGKKMENSVYLQLLRKKNKSPILSFYYFKDYQQREVDFVIKEKNRIKELIQVSYSNSFDEIERREIKNIIKASEFLGCNELKIITWDYEDSKIIEGKLIKFVPLWKWLLNDSQNFSQKPL